MTDVRLINVNDLYNKVLEASYWDNRDEDVFWTMIQDVPTVNVVDKIASFLEQEENWRKLRSCWLENDRSEDLRKLLKQALAV